MAKWLIEVEVTSSGSQADVADWFATTLSESHFYPHNLTVRLMPEPLRLSDFPSQSVRRRTGDETYRVVIPGLFKEGKEVTVPIYEDDVDLELLDHCLNGG